VTFPACRGGSHPCRTLTDVMPSHIALWGTSSSSFSIRPGRKASECSRFRPIALPRDRGRRGRQRGGHDRSRFRRCTPDADANAAGQRGKTRSRTPSRPRPGRSPLTRRFHRDVPSEHGTHGGHTYLDDELRTLPGPSPMRDFRRSASRTTPGSPRSSASTADSKTFARAGSTSSPTPTWARSSAAKTSGRN